MQEVSEAIAVVGMSGRFPGARNIDEFWQNLCNGVSSIVFFSGEEAIASGLDPAFVDNPNFIRAYGVLDDIELFDPAFFNMSPREARVLDPQHRLFLECSWEALEHAGYDSERYPGRIGVFAGAGMSTYLLRSLLPSGIFNFVTAERLEMAISNQKDLMPMRVSYELNLTGPSINISTTCSTSLVAVHLSCQSLLTYECDMILCGGSFVRVPQKEGYLYQEGTVYSHDGYIHAFDAQARGIVIGSGVGVVLLKRLEDALADRDQIYAVIRGSAVNNDGATKLGYTAPSADGQAAATAQAISLAGIPSDTITYVEAHGTGTALGDPIEFASLQKAFRATAADPEQQARQFCAIGSVKTNLGHTNHAAGITGLIKTILALHHKVIPPSLNFETPNPKLDFANSPFFVNTQLREWHANGIPRRALNNSFGIGGTNAHVVTEEAPEPQPSGPARPWQLLLLSAKTPSALDTMTANLAQHLAQHPDLNLADVSYTLHVGRRAMPYRRMLVSHDITDAVAMLAPCDPKRVQSEVSSREAPSVVFLFSGQGAQYTNMGRDLYTTEPVFRQQVDSCAEMLKPYLGRDLRDLLYPDADKTAEANHLLQQTAFTQPALFVIEYALAQLWISWGIQPQAMVGHSIGEYVAACLAGVFSLDVALKLVAARGQLMQEMPPGAMLAVELTPPKLQPLLTDGLSLAVVNSPAMCVAAGDFAVIDSLQQQLIAQGVTCSRLHTSHAFHSAMMDPIVEPFVQCVAEHELHPPQLPYLSNVTGTWITAEEATDPAYWGRHLRQTVLFADNVQHLVQNTAHILLEVGPGRTLSSLVKQHPMSVREQVVLTSVRHPKEEQSDAAFLLTTLGKLWLHGVHIDWSAFWQHEQRSRVALPTYPFERKYYWIAPPLHQQQAPVGDSTAMLAALDQESEAPDVSGSSNTTAVSMTPTEQAIARIWQEVLFIENIGIHEDFFDLGGSSLIAIALAARISERFQMSELGAQTLLNAPTIAELAKIIDAAAPTAQHQPAAPGSLTLPPSLVRLKQGNPKVSPLFLVHPIEGHVFVYRTLAQILQTERPIYAFQAPGIDQKDVVFTDIKDIAAHYIAALRTLQPQGPYMLGGFSFGGMVAFEMAQQLQAQQQAVDLLFLIDTPSINNPLFSLDDDAAILSFLSASLFQLNEHRLSPEELRGLPFEQQVAALMARIEQSTHAALPLTPDQIHTIVQVVKSNHQAITRYAPQRYNGQMVVFQAMDPCQITSYWLNLAEQGGYLITIPGNHFTLNQQPAVQTIASRLEMSLRQIEQGIW
ncbi:MAG: acyltransferase domain-containing protein [Chloroflexaceae bacterium]|nr:acyltransferase domain-containing protein [Chloroflexaceae bacterium]